MPELFNQGLLDRLKDLQSKVNSAINGLNSYTRFRAEMTTGAKTTRISDMNTACTALGVATTDWLGNDDPSA